DGSAPPARALGPKDGMPQEYWDALMRDIQADAGPVGNAIQSRRLCEIQPHVLRIGCRRCNRTVEIRKADAVRLYGQDAIWKDVGQRILDQTCEVRTGRYEEDGCWPTFETR